MNQEYDKYQMAIICNINNHIVLFLTDNIKWSNPDDKIFHISTGYIPDKKGRRETFMTLPSSSFIAGFTTNENETSYIQAKTFLDNYLNSNYSIYNESQKVKSLKRKTDK